MNEFYTYIHKHGAKVGRVLIGLLFVLSALGILMNGVAGTAEMIAMKGLPMATVLAWLVIIFKIVAGCAFIVGYQTEKVAYALIVFVLVATALYHLNLQDINLLKNLAIVGGLLVIASNSVCTTCNVTAEQKNAMPTMAM